MAPVNVMFGCDPPWHTAVVPLIVAAGNGLTVTVTLPVCGWLQVVMLPSRTLTRVYTNDPDVVVGAVTVVVLLPDNVLTV